MLGPVRATDGAASARNVARHVALNVWSWQAPMAAQRDGILAACKAANPGLGVALRAITKAALPEPANLLTKAITAAVIATRHAIAGLTADIAK
jgi:hypothetical protein